MYNSYPFGGYQNVLPQQQIIQVNGRASVDTIQLAPNSSVLVMDTSAPIVWLCISDGVGRVTATPYDISVHKENAPTDVSDVERRIAALEDTIAKMEERINVKPNVNRNK